MSKFHLSMYNVLFILVVLLLLPGMVMAKDWYVAEGSDGDGTKENPFDDPQRALEAAVSGDVIHVTQGTYYGKLRVGYIVLEKRGLTLVGGYKDKTFTERNPFKYPTMITTHPQSKSSTFDGPDIRVKHTTEYADHWSTTVDGFWFDRKSQNGYVPLDAPIDKGPGNLGVPIGSNTKPVIIFEHPDCHVRNCVFLNSAMYTLRITGDGSSVENNVFINSNYCCLDIYGKGEKLGKGYRFHKILIKNNTFVSIWNARSLERGAGSFIVNENADITITDNIFHLSNGNKTSMGYVIKDERNFNADKWIHLLRNSISQIRGGIATVYMPDLKASVNIDFMKDLRDTPWEVKDNDQENPFFDFDKEWLTDYARAIPKDDPSSKKINVSEFEIMMSRLTNKPINAGVINLGGAYLARWYPIEHAKTGAFLKPTNAKMKNRGVQADGPFSIVKGTLVKESQESADATKPVREYKEIDWNTLWTSGESLIDQSVKFKAYYIGNDTSYYSMSSKGNEFFLKGADQKTHIIIQLRKVEEMDRKDYPVKGFIAKGSEAENYLKKNARRPCPDKKKACEDSFIVYGIVKKAGAGVNMGVGPQIVIVIENITTAE